MSPPGALTKKLLRRRGRDGDAGDAAGLRDGLLAEAAVARRLPSDPDWDVIETPGIRWGGPIREQGGPWEDHAVLPEDVPDEAFGGAILDALEISRAA